MFLNIAYFASVKMLMLKTVSKIQSNLKGLEGFSQNHFKYKVIHWAICILKRVPQFKNV